jgi:hypothetical protein
VTLLDWFPLPVCCLCSAALGFWLGHRRGWRACNLALLRIARMRCRDVLGEK